MNQYYISIRDLSKTIKDRTVLDGVNLDITRQSIVGFVGRNGSGKTMLFRAIGGLIKPSAGTIRIDGKVLGQDISFPENMGIIIENIGLWNYMTGVDALSMLAAIRKKVEPSEVCDAIRRVGLNPDDKRKIGKYSLGMKQRLVFAQAIMERPALLILDEPTNALDTDGVDLIRNIILEERARGATVLIASHQKEDIASLCDYTVYMNEGRIGNTP